MDTGTGLDVESWVDAGRAVIEPVGEIDVYTVHTLRRVLEELPAPARYRVAIQMSGVEFVDSSGLGVLVWAMKRARNGGGALALAGCHDRVLRILRITGLVRVMVPFLTLEEALRHVDEVASEQHT